MKALFVDTAGWVACADSVAPAHLRCCAARDVALEAGQTLVTTTKSETQVLEGICPATSRIIPIRSTGC